MYKIIKDGKALHIVDKLHYIRRHENGCFVEADEDEAQGIAVAGTPYSIAGHELEGAAGEVTAVAVDAGAELSALLAENQALSDNVNLLMLALVEEHERQLEESAALKQELAELKGGLNE